MKKEFFEDNKILEYLKLLKSHGRLDDEAMLNAVDVLSEPGNARLMREFFDEQAVKIADIVLNGKPFPLPDENADGPIRIAVAGNNQLIGFYPEECHFLIAGQTGTGKSTLLKIIFGQALLFNRAQEKREENGKNNLLAIS